MSKIRKAWNSADRASNYRIFRPKYSPEMFSFIGNNFNTSSILEVGCGTGLATLQLYSISQILLSIEPNSAMLNEAKELIDAEGIHFECCSLEKFDTVETFDIIFAGQSLHWVNKEERYSKPFSLLKNEGVLLQAYNCVVEDTPFFWDEHEIEKKIFKERVGERKPFEELYSLAKKKGHKEISATGLFEVEFEEFENDQVFNAGTYIGWIDSWSRSGRMTDDEKSKLYSALEDCINNKHDGNLKIPMKTLLIIC